MPTLQAFDGDTLEAALARVNAEVGRDARIKQAEKVRTGGVAGFFARERFEVTVEIGDDTDGLHTTDELDATAPPSHPAAARSLLDLAEEVSQRERVAVEPTHDVGDGPASAAASDVDTSLPKPSTEGRTFQEVLRGIASQAGLLDGGGGVAGPAGTAPAQARPVRSGPDPSSAQADHAPACSVPSAIAALGIPQQLVGAPTGGRSVAQEILCALERMPAAAPVTARRGDVIAIVGEEKVALEAAGMLAGQLGQTLDDVVLAGLDRSGFNTLSSPEDARRQTELWRSCGAPFIVAVCPPEGHAGMSWARTMLAALDPVTVWGAVRADRKPDDVTAWVERLDRVDALAVSGCADTSSPAAVLSTGIPVAALEGRKATPAAWTALLVERLVP